MTQRHDDIFDAVLSGVPQERDTKDGKAGVARFLKRGNAIASRLSGAQEEKTLHWVEPSQCRMWARHNRDYSLLTEENCRDLIEGIRVQGRQEFPAIVRRLDDGGAHDFEVVCGARRHFAVSWLQANNYPNFKYLIEVRDLSDEEAFRLADIENRDREDISDYERAQDYADAVKRYYGGKQRAMAERLEVSEVWLSRYLDLAKLPDEVVSAFPSIRDIRELHARTLKPLLRAAASREAVLSEARKLSERQRAAWDGQGAFVDAAKVVAALKSSCAEPKAKTGGVTRYGSGMGVVQHSKRGKTHRLEFEVAASKAELEAAFKAFLKATF